MDAVDANSEAGLVIDHWVLGVGNLGQWKSRRGQGTGRKRERPV